MESKMAANLSVVFLSFILLFPAASSENDLNLTFCGTWRHDTGPLSVNVDLSPGCSGMSVSANESALSIDGKITAHCQRSDVIPLSWSDSTEESHFCLHWEPLLDQLKLEIHKQSLILCWPSSLHGSCCTDLSQGPNSKDAEYGIRDGRVRTDLITDKTRMSYSFVGIPISCKALCDQVLQGSTQVNMVDEATCAPRVVEVKENAKGYNMTSPIIQAESKKPAVTIFIPPAINPAKDTNEISCTFYKNNALFQEGLEDAWVLNDVVEIVVENKIIIGLSEPIRIGFRHDVMPKNHSRKCVSWDTRKDPLHINWLEDGCETRQHGPEFTECLCNHLTYFSILVQLEPRPVCHLVELTVITSLGCAVSVISCIALIVFLLKNEKKKRSKEQSVHIHLGLAVSFAGLYLIFFLTAVLANVAGESVCFWVGALLHYTLLSSLIWMGIEVFHTFWLVYVVFIPSPKTYIWNLLGYGVPAVPVAILMRVGDIYGLREVKSCDETERPFLMCWMTENREAVLAHYFTTLTVLAILVTSGIVMLFLVYRQIHKRVEWQQNRVVFLSIWGLSCLFGTTWSVTFLGFGPQFEFVTFIFCILNSFQGFFLMMRFYMVNWIRKKAGGSALGSTSTGSTRQHMLQVHEKS
ncbi:uncharacterized protein V6R79_018101 [Siganus canaliculatus]